MEWLEHKADYSAEHGAADYRRQVVHMIGLASINDLILAHFSFASDMDTFGQCDLRDADGAGAATIVVDLSPNRRNRAITWHEAAWIGPLLWVNGTEVEVPQDATGNPCTDAAGCWIDNRFYTIEVSVCESTQANSAAASRRRISALGDVRGLLIWDARTETRWVELPRSDQRWSSPRAIHRDGQIVIYANASAQQRNDPDRAIAAPVI